MLIVKTTFGQTACDKLETFGAQPKETKKTTIGCVVPAWSTRGNPKLCRGKPKLCRGKSKLCRGPTNPKISQNHVRSENVGLNL